MSTSTESASVTPPASPAATGALIEQISFRQIYDGLAQNNIHLTAAEQASFEEIAREEIRKQNGGNLIGLNIGGAGVNILEILFSFIQKLFGGETPGTLAGWGDQLSGAFSGATNTGKQYVINTINANIYDRMRAHGGNLAEAADLVTGLTTGPGYARDMGCLKGCLKGCSLMRQLTTIQNVPAGTSSSLNPPPAPTEVADASGGHGLPPSTSTRPLTPAAPGA